MARRWIIPAPAHDLAELACRWSVPPVVAQLLVNRGVAETDGARQFLTPNLTDLHPPDDLPGARRAAGLIADAVRAEVPIVLYGDYDVDGIAGVAVLWHVLRCAGATVTFYVPHRIEEGYGLNVDAVTRLIDDGAGLIVSVDCGVTAAEAAEAAQRRGVPLIITDHHVFTDALPPAAAIVHPGLDGAYGNPDLCGAGVAFKLAWAVAQELSGSPRVAPHFRELLLEMLPLAALGTIADVVDLCGENRVLARHGLQRLDNTSLPGLVMLMAQAGLHGRRISGYDVGYKLAPRLNAAGRMGHARLAVELLTRADEARAREIALYLEEHNRSRKAAERQIVKQAMEVVERRKLASDARRAIVVASEGWHAGVIGIAAARVVERYHRPAVLVALADGAGQGSARSIRSFDVAAALRHCGEHLTAYGGHAMAAGLRLRADRVEPFSEAFVQVANQRLTGDNLVPTLRLDAEVRFTELTLETVQGITALGPFGVGNPRPKLATGWVRLAEEPRCVGAAGEHLSATFEENGVRVRAIGFGLAGSIEDLKEHRRCRLAFEPIINEYKGRRGVEMQLIDLKFDARP